MAFVMDGDKQPPGNREKKKKEKRSFVIKLVTPG